MIPLLWIGGAVYWASVIKKHDPQKLLGLVAQGFNAYFELAERIREELHGGYQYASVVPEDQSYCRAGYGDDLFKDTPPGITSIDYGRAILVDPESSICEWTPPSIPEVSLGELYLRLLSCLFVFVLAYIFVFFIIVKLPGLLREYLGIDTTRTSHSLLPITPREAHEDSSHLRSRIGRQRSLSAPFPTRSSVLEGANSRIQLDLDAIQPFPQLSRRLEESGLNVRLETDHHEAPQETNSRADDEILDDSRARLVSLEENHVLAEDQLLVEHERQAPQTLQENLHADVTNSEQPSIDDLIFDDIHVTEQNTDSADLGNHNGRIAEGFPIESSRRVETQGSDEMASPSGSGTHSRYGSHSTRSVGIQVEGTPDSSSSVYPTVIPSRCQLTVSSDNLSQISERIASEVSSPVASPQGGAEDVVYSSDVSARVGSEGSDVLTSPDNSTVNVSSRITEAVALEAAEIISIARSPTRHPGSIIIEDIHGVQRGHPSSGVEEGEEGQEEEEQIRRPAIALSNLWDVAPPREPFARLPDFPYPDHPLRRRRMIQPYLRGLRIVLPAERRRNPPRRTSFHVHEVTDEEGFRSADSSLGSSPEMPSSAIVYNPNSAALHMRRLRRIQSELDLETAERRRRLAQRASTAVIGLSPPLRPPPDVSRYVNIRFAPSGPMGQFHHSLLSVETSSTIATGVLEPDAGSSSASGAV